MYDTIIIGSGPAGLSAAVYAKRAALNTVVIEKNYGGTGQIAESERVDNYLGLYGESGFDLGERFRAHAKALGTEFYEGEVTAVLSEADGYRVRLSDGAELQTRTIVYAAGASPRKLCVKGEAEFARKGVSYCAVCDGAFYKDKTVAVIGGGDTALGDALYLANTAKKVYIVHRRDQFRANRLLQERVSNTDNIELILNAVPTEIAGSKRTESLHLIRGGQGETLSVDGIFIAIGTIPNSGILQGLAALSADGYVIAGEDCATSAKGIFAAGDVRTKPLKQVSTAVADGANSILSVTEYLEENGR
ncbi:MAG: FAD-dependent oxidoreductase [Clostridia bacterium]|nr:FAD-dependent oxidoreductase [Clostridia bacterium]